MGRAATLVAASVLVVTAAFVTSSARADGDAAAPPAYAYSYEVENADPTPEHVLVVWPRICSASGEPLGKVDLALNPDWATRMNDVDYEVIVTGKHHELADSCRKTSRLYALAASAFPRGMRSATADDSAIGQHVVGQPFPIVPLLDAVDRKRRIELFEKDPRVSRTAFQLDEPSKPSKPLKAMHEVLALGSFTPTTFVVVQKRVDYTYQDGTSETVTPHPDTAEATADAGAKSSSAANPGANTPESPPLDIGTRWVFLAAVGGLVAGGLIAFYRKKRS